MGSASSNSPTKIHMKENSPKTISTVKGNTSTIMGMFFRASSKKVKGKGRAVS